MTLTWDEARKFVETHAPGCELGDEITNLYGCCFYPDRKLIKWAPSFGVDVLCHELGHAVLGVSNIRGMMIPSKEEQNDEIAAWLWSEEICHKEGWDFDYEKAERSLRSYLLDPPTWKYKGVKNEN